MSQVGHMGVGPLLQPASSRLCLLYEYGFLHSEAVPLCTKLGMRVLSGLVLDVYAPPAPVATHSRLTASSESANAVGKRNKNQD